MPKCVDDYLDALRRFPDVAEEKRPEQDVWHIGQRGASVPGYGAQVNFSMVNNLSLHCADSADLLVDYLNGMTKRPQNTGSYLALVEKGLNYYRNFVLLSKSFREPNDAERALNANCREASGCGCSGRKCPAVIPFDIARSVDGAQSAVFCFMKLYWGKSDAPRFGFLPVWSA